MKIKTVLVSIAILTICLFSGCTGGKTQLFNGKDFDGWDFYHADPQLKHEAVWSIKDGYIRCEGKPNGYMATIVDHENYKLHVEWRWPEEPTNSGIFLHIPPENGIWPTTIECQLKNGNAGDFVLLSGAQIKEKTVKKKNPSNEKPIGEWNTAEIICKGDKIKIYINGLLQNTATEATRSYGRIAQQSEGSPIEFRNVFITSLGK